MVHLRSHHQSNEVWEFCSSRGPTKEVRLLHLAKNLRQALIFFVVSNKTLYCVVEMINYVVSFTLVIRYNCLTAV